MAGVGHAGVAGVAGAWTRTIPGGGWWQHGPGPGHAAGQGGRWRGPAPPRPRARACGRHNNRSPPPHAGLPTWALPLLLPLARSCCWRARATSPGKKRRHGTPSHAHAPPQRLPACHAAHTLLLLPPLTACSFRMMMLRGGQRGQPAPNQHVTWYRPWRTRDQQGPAGAVDAETGGIDLQLVDGAPRRGDIKVRGGKGEGGGGGCCSWRAAWCKRRARLGVRGSPLRCHNRVCPPPASAAARPAARHMRGRVCEESRRRQGPGRQGRGRGPGPRRVRGGAATQHGSRGGHAPGRAAHAHRWRGRWRRGPSGPSGGAGGVAAHQQQQRPVASCPGAPPVGRAAAGPRATAAVHALPPAAPPRHVAAAPAAQPAQRDVAGVAAAAAAARPAHVSPPVHLL